MLSFQPGRKAIGSSYSSDEAAEVGAKGDNIMTPKIAAINKLRDFNMWDMLQTWNYIVYYFSCDLDYSVPGASTIDTLTQRSTVTKRAY